MNLQIFTFNLLLEEGFCFTVLEAALNNTPIIGTDTGAIEEIINSTHGLIVNLDVNEIAKKIILLHSNLLDKLKKIGTGFSLSGNIKPKTRRYFCEQVNSFIDKNIDDFDVVHILFGIYSMRYLKISDFRHKDTIFWSYYS